jgi:hypothetical protein
MFIGWEGAFIRRAICTEADSNVKRETRASERAAFTESIKKWVQHCQSLGKWGKSPGITIRGCRPFTSKTEPHGGLREGRCDKPS